MECSPNIFYAGAVPNQRCQVVAKPQKQGFLFDPDYVYPRTVNTIIKNWRTGVADRILPLGNLEVRRSIRTHPTGAPERRRDLQRSEWRQQRGVLQSSCAMQDYFQTSYPVMSINIAEEETYLAGHYLQSYFQTVNKRSQS